MNQVAIEIKLITYANLREHITSGDTIEIMDGSSISRLREFLSQQYPGCPVVLKTCRFAVDGEIIDNQFELKEQSEVHILPPSSGG